MDDAMDDAMVDGGATSDVLLDSDLSVKYDVGYVSEFGVSSGFSSVLGLLLVVNRGMRPLNVADVTVVSVANDTPGANVNFTKVNNAVMMLSSDRAAGSLSPIAKSLIVDSGLVAEAIDDTYLNFRLDFPQTLPAPGTIFNSQVVLRIEEKDVALPFVFHVVENGGIDFANVRRISSKL